jgi:bifunctional oligoribonuclease and PAP phosphatase NrnA
MPLDWTPFVEFIRRPARFLLLTHVRPDGDALGSQLGMADLLEQLGKSVRVVIGSRFPERYHFMDTGKRIERFASGSDCFGWAEAIIVLDTGAWSQLGDCSKAMQQRDVPKFVIDHHLKPDDLGATLHVDPSAEATARLVYEAFEALAKKPTPAAAEAIFIGLAMDTGWFHHSSTRAETFILAEKLVRAGASPERVYEQLYERSTLGRLRLQGRVLERMQSMLDGRVVLTEVYVSDYAATGSVPADTEDFVQYTRGVADVEVGMLLIEQHDGQVKVSFRARDKVNVAVLAQQFGGGGHARAAGATLPGPISAARATVLAAVERALQIDGVTG